MKNMFKQCEKDYIILYNEYYDSKGSWNLLVGVHKIAINSEGID